MTQSKDSTNWHQYLKDEDLLVEQFNGELNLKTLKQAKEQQIKELEDLRPLQLLSDIRSATLTLNFEEVKAYKSYMQEQEKAQYRRLAILTNSPMQVALASLYKSHAPYIQTEIEIFSTLEVALDWLNRLEHFQSINQLLQNNAG